MAKKDGENWWVFEEKQENGNEDKKQKVVPTLTSSSTYDRASSMNEHYFEQILPE